MLPKKGNKLHRQGNDNETGVDFNLKIAEALRTELGSTHRSVKTVMHWTGASERAVKNWFAGSHGPSGGHLVALVHNSDTVLKAFLLMAGRNRQILSFRLADLRRCLIESIECIDRPD